MKPKLHVLVPFWGLAGGVIKVLDYAEHGHHGGFEVTLWATTPGTSDPLVTSLPVMERLLAAGVTYRPLDELSEIDLGEQDRLLFTEPAHAAIVDRMGAPAERLIHLVQGTRHATPTWNNGLHYRLLHRPFVRIAVSEQVRSAIAPHVHKALPLHLVPEGHDIDYFTLDRSAMNTGTPLRVLYSTWKSDLGDAVEKLCDPTEVVFTAMRSAQSWPSLRNYYRAADIFLAAPGPEEGFYLPGLEAMAAQCAVVMALVGGNEAYATPGHNMITASFDDATEHAAAISQLAGDTDLRAALLAAGLQTAQGRRLEHERNAALRILRSPLENYDEIDSQEVAL